MVTLRFLAAQFLFAIILLASASAKAEEPSRFIDKIQPLLEGKCISCHGPEKQEGNLRLDSLMAAQAGGDRGPAIHPGDLEKSLLVKAITFLDPDLQMPPKQRLTEEEVATLTQWVQEGAPWPEPAVVLFEDDPKFLAHLTGNNGTARLITDDSFSGKAAFAVTPLQREGAKIPGWAFPIRENPKPGEYRYLRLAWKKRGEGSIMLELAASGVWPDAKVPAGRYVAGKNTTGWAAHSMSDVAPNQWSTVTFDLWKDIGNFTLTGLAPTCDRGEEAFFDALLLGPSIASLDAYRPGMNATDDGQNPIGDAFTDKRNPIRKLFRGERLDLWSLKKPIPSPPPTLPGVSNPIDAFLQTAQAKSGITPSPEADRRTLIRRLTFDLTGLPPTHQEVDTFLADQSIDAYDKLVTRLLNSPHYGPRQARLWLDVVRYADTHGYERDEFRTLAWQYRDYVIRAFNQDKPFDQFIREQIAGDELLAAKHPEQPRLPYTPDEADLLIATGYLRLGQWDSTATIFQEEDRLRAEQMADLTNTTSAAFLGLTMSCCQCHDHKYDPLSQADHYRLRAFFAAVTPHDDLAISLADEQAEIEQHNAKIDDQSAPLKAEQSTLAKDNKSRHDELMAQLNQLESQKRKPRHAMGATDSGSTPAPTHVFYQGDFSSPRDEVLPGFPSIFTPAPSAPQPPAGTTTGRRLALANWIASSENPWTARVIVNRIWQQHFGTGLVATPNDFGYSGARPTHPELLDWLSVDFTNHDWSIKQLHRQIVTSAAYRQSSLETPNQRQVDPDNHLLWRQNVRRLDAETLRDNLLAVSGLLKPYDAGKPLWPAVPEELLKAQPAILEAEKGGDAGRMQGWYADPIDQTDVRSIFLVRKRCLPIPFLQAFDLPDTTVSCARRDSTVVAPQALMLLNSPEALRYAQALAAKLTKATDKLLLEEPVQIDPLVDNLFREALNRLPTADERQLSTDLLLRHKKQHDAAGDLAPLLAFTDLCRAILNLNEFAYVD